MLIPENSFSIILPYLDEVKSCLNFIDSLERSHIRLNITSQNKQEVVFKIEHNTNYKTINQWFCDDDMRNLLTKLEATPGPMGYVDEDAEEGYKVTLDTNTLGKETITIRREFWICGK